MPLSDLFARASGDSLPGVLYNITFNLNDESTLLQPYIPYSAAEDEDRETKRVCFADSVDNCISAIGSCARELYEGSTIVVRSVQTDKLDKSKLITPHQLAASGKVPDAEVNQEYWYLGDVNIVREVRTIVSFEYEYAIAFQCLNKDDVNALIKKYLPDDGIRDGESIEDAYNRVIGAMQSVGEYDASDEFDDSIAELPWAQRIRVQNVVLE